MEQTIIQIGNSSGISIPAPILKSLKLQKGDKVVLVVDKDRDSFLVEKVQKIKPKKEATQGTRASSKEFKNWLKEVLHEDAEILDELSVR